MNAHFHAVHLFAVMTKLLPGWLPRALFDLLHRQWLSPERRARSAHDSPLRVAQCSTCCTASGSRPSVAPGQLMSHLCGLHNVRPAAPILALARAPRQVSSCLTLLPVCLNA
jgi:hypothetical protein